MNTNKKNERVLEDVQIKLSGLWVALILTYLLGSVLGILAGDMMVGEIDGIEGTPIMWFGLAIVMVIPVVMVFLSLSYSWSRRANIIAAIIFMAINLIGVLQFTNAYITFLIIVGLGLNVLILRYARKWTKQEGMRHT